jgi:Flp pilus assembly pilin Flp
MKSHMHLAARLLLDDAGQDLVEYALLTGVFAAIGALIFVTMRDNMGGWYTAWGTEIQTNWEPNPPGA